MKKVITTICVVALFFVLCAIPASANPADTEEEKGPGWKYVLAGRITNYEVVEYDGVEYLHCKAFRVNSIWWNVLDKLPNLPLPSNIRLGQEFNIPSEGAKIIGPTPIGHFFIVAKGVL